jgi:predicted RNA-binding protein YlxR (DUF448 family)
MRSCAGCRLRRPAEELVRITWSSGAIVVDGPSSGRGVWLCRAAVAAEVVVDPGCLDTALAKRAFAKGWRTSLGPTDDDIRTSVGGWGG